MSAPALYAFPAPQRSAGLLRWGLVLVLLSLAGTQFGASLTLDWAFAGGRGDDPGSVVTVFSYLGLLVGAACTGTGIRRLATSVDYVAFRIHQLEHGQG